MKIKHSTYKFKSNELKRNPKFHESAFVLNLGRGELNIGRAFHSQRKKEKTLSFAVDNLNSSGSKKSFKSCPKVQFINSSAFPPFSFIHHGDQSSLSAICYILKPLMEMSPGNYSKVTGGKPPHSNLQRNGIFQSDL